MTPEARRFYLRYYLLARLAPVYAMALLCYGAAWLCLHWGGSVGLACAVLTGTLLAAVGAARLPLRVGFRLCGLRPTRMPPGTAPYEEVSQALGGVLEHLPLELNLLVLGPLLFIAGQPAPEVVIWASEHALRSLPPPALRAVLLHELGHCRETSGLAWEELLWVLVIPVVWLLHETPLQIIAAALVHAQLWLHLQQWLRENGEAKADRWAAQRMGKLEYAAALSGYLAHFEQGASTRLRRSRLRGMGLTPAEIDEVLA